MNGFVIGKTVDSLPMSSRKGSSLELVDLVSPKEWSITNGSETSKPTSLSDSLHESKEDNLGVWTIMAKGV
jgi:hypothetical protein